MSIARNNVRMFVFLAKSLSDVQKKKMIVD